MQKWKLFKQTAAGFLSLAVAAAGMPSAAIAAELDFGDESAFVEEIPEESEETVSFELEDAAPEEDTVLIEETAGETALFAEEEFQDGQEELFSDEEESDLFTTEEDAADADYKYVYAGLSWSEYWAAEDVYAAGNTASSQEVDAKGETDKGAFDTVTRATVNHGLHRGSYQCIAVIYGEKSTYEVSYWTSSSNAVLTDGRALTFSRGDITLEDGTTDVMDYYVVTGLKYVPVKVKAEDYEEFCACYPVVENDGAMAGGYGEVSLQSYTAAANVTASTNGLKTAIKNEDGSFSFSARAVGTDSGLKDTEIRTADGIIQTVKPADGAYGEFLRVDLTGNYGGLGAAMQAVKWTYYGDDSSYTTPLVSYGTKFAADNWMHKSNGIQLGLTDSLRCQLPEGYDGTGYWTITVYALGYQDYTIQIQATEDNVVKASAEEIDTTALEAAIAQAEALKESSYTSDSWAAMKMELEEAKDELSKPHSQAAVDEAVSHLNEAIKALVEVQTPAEPTQKPLPTATPAPQVTVKPAVPTAAPTATPVPASGIKLSKTKATLYTKGTTKLTLKTTKTRVTGTVTYTSSNKKVAVVSSKGVVTAKKKGTATITAKCGKYKATCKITVKNPTLKLAKSSATIKKGKKVTIKATATPAKTIKYKSSNKKVATVTSKGVVKGVKKGKATITVTCNGVTKKFKVTVK